MKNIERLEKRIRNLESIPEPELVDRALDCLSYEQVLLVEEAKGLSDAGFSEGQMADMMGERWQELETAMLKLNTEYDRLAKTKRRKQQQK